jgi:hypothetical protein
VCARRIKLLLSKKKMVPTGIPADLLNERKEDNLAKSLNLKTALDLEIGKRL